MSKRLAVVRLLVALLLLVPVAVSAALPDIPHPRQLTIADGLPSNRINDLAEDRDGYLWLATADGLARYDGTGFRVWRSEQGLPDNMVWSLALDSAGRVWIGTAHAGLAMYDPELDSFRSFGRDDAPEIVGSEVWMVRIDADDNVWFGTSSAGLYRMDREGRVDRFMPHEGDERSLPHASVRQLAFGPDGALWVGTTDGVARWTGSDFERVPADALPDGRINGLAFDRAGTLWIGTPRGVVARSADGTLDMSRWRRNEGPHEVMQVLLQDSRGYYWLDIPAGVGLADVAGDVANVPLYSSSARGEVRPLWSAAHEDREGGVWLLSSSHGLWYQPAGWDRFQVLVRQVGNPQSPGNAHVRGIAPAAGGGMWLVGSGGVLDRLDLDTGRIERVAEDVGQGLILRSVHEDRFGRVWVGYAGGMARIDIGTGQVRRWGRQDAVLQRGDVRNFVESAEGLLWIGIDEVYLQVRDLEGRVLHTFEAGDGSGLGADEAIKVLAAGMDGTPWLATSVGLRRPGADGGSWEPVPGAEPGMVSAFVAAGDTVWLSGMGTLDGYRWDGHRLHRLHRLGVEDGLPLVMFNGLTVDAEDVVWLTSVRGLVRVDPKQKVVRVYGVDDGLPGQEFRNPPVAHPADGRILAGTPDGMVIFDPTRIAAPGGKPNLAIERIDVRQRTGLGGFAPDAPFSIRHDDRDLRVVARLLSFRNPALNRYSFRLADYDEDWVDVGAGGERVFSQLPAGRYDLQIRARNADNIWSQVRNVHFEVMPPWWRTPAARLSFVLCALVLLWVLAALYRARLRRRHAWQLAEHKRELAEQASLAKTRFLATLGHEVRTPMTGVLGMSELLLATSLDDHQRGYTESIHRAGGHLMRLVDDALDLARIEAGRLRLDPQPFSLRTLLDDAVGLMVPLAEQHGLQFREHVARNVPNWLSGDAMRVRQILLNLLGNAIKFTESGYVELRVEALQAEGIRLVVSDTGPGLNEEQKQRLFRRFEQAEGARTAARYGGSGLGLAICQELAAEMGGRIEVDSAPGKGTRFSVELPLPKASAAAETPPPDTRADGSRALSLLLVEDDATIAEVIVGMLHARGHRVTRVAHGLAAMGEIASGDFDLALLDLDLPGIDGIALARQLRAQGFRRPLVAITARVDADAERLAREVGFDDFLRKPLTGDMLAAAIGALVPRQEAGEDDAS